MDASLHHDPATLWAPRRQLALAQARRRWCRVTYLRYAFVAAAAISIGLFLGFVFRSALSQEAGPPKVNDAEAVTMINPRFTGRDSSGDIFTITAEAAQRRRAEGGVVDLVNAGMRGSKGSQLKAPTGYYDRERASSSS